MVCFEAGSSSVAQVCLDLSVLSVPGPWVPSWHLYTTRPPLYLSTTRPGSWGCFCFCFCLGGGVYSFLPYVTWDLISNSVTHLSKVLQCLDFSFCKQVLISFNFMTTPRNIVLFNVLFIFVYSVVGFFSFEFRFQALIQSWLSKTYIGG